MLDRPVWNEIIQFSFNFFRSELRGDQGKRQETKGLKSSSNGKGKKKVLTFAVRVSSADLISRNSTGDVLLVGSFLESSSDSSRNGFELVHAPELQPMGRRRDWEGKGD